MSVECISEIQHRCIHHPRRDRLIYRLWFRQATGCDHGRIPPHPGRDPRGDYHDHCQHVQDITVVGGGTNQIGLVE